MGRTGLVRLVELECLRPLLEWRALMALTARLLAACHVCQYAAFLADIDCGSYLRCHTHNETLLFDLVGLDSVVILQDLARVDELLRRRLPALLCADLLLDLADALGRFGVDGELLLLEVLEGELHDGR